MTDIVRMRVEENCKRLYLGTISSRLDSLLEEAARQQLLKFFEALGFTDPLSVDGRKRLSSILFS